MGIGIVVRKKNLKSFNLHFNFKTLCYRIFFKDLCIKLQIIYSPRPNKTLNFNL